MQLVTSRNRRPPAPPKQTSGGDLPDGRDRENLLKLIQWFHQRRAARHQAERHCNSRPSLACNDSRQFAQQASKLRFESN
ncbi:MAG: hypothetical protein Q8M16_18905 [Pirellulaceae bacterium]|nr:hypothetical protein [Pirellulaceae bacterium]